MIRGVFGCLLVAFAACDGNAQPEHTANDTVPELGEHYGYGVNFGFYPFTDSELADLAAGNDSAGIGGVGATTIRPALPEKFLEYWGYDIRKDAFRHYQALGMTNLVAFIGYPSAAHRDPTVHCPGGDTSELFRNMYLPIWDGGANGTPVNDENFYALYLYKMLQVYGPYVRIWEVWNEPDFDNSGNGWKPRNMPGNWWESPPQPCDIALRAPYTHYVRLLRISYEVIKTLQPDDYVAVGGLGYPSFLDVVMRNTDNPTDGSATPDFPLKGGAYFDMLSFHSYPSIDGSLRKWSNDVMGFVYSRHSDAAAMGVVARKNEFDEVLRQYGYDGSQHPRKRWIVTECNIPRIEFGDNIGSDEAQRNFVIKSAVAAQKAGIRQIHLYALAEIAEAGKGRNEFDHMGLYPFFAPKSDLKAQQPLSAGVAHATMSRLLHGKGFDGPLTDAMILPLGVSGGAFSGPNGERVLVLWATTTQDRSEVARAEYTLPATFGMPFARVYPWDFSRTGFSSVVATQRLVLTGTPVFLVAENADTAGYKLVPQGGVSTFPNPSNDLLKTQFDLTEPTEVTVDLLDFAGKFVSQLQPKTMMPKGPHQLNLQPPTALPTGVYFLRIKLGKAVQYQKVLLRP